MKITFTIEMPDVPIETLLAAKARRMETSLALAKMTRDASMRAYSRQRLLTYEACRAYRELFAGVVSMVNAHFAKEKERVLADLADLLPDEVIKDDLLIHPDHQAIAEERDRVDRKD